MLQCWASNAEDRPGFDFIYNRLHVLAQEMGDKSNAPTAMQIVSGEKDIYNTGGEAQVNLYNTAPPTTSPKKKMDDDEDTYNAGIQKIEIYNNNNNNSNYTSFQEANPDIYNTA